MGGTGTLASLVADAGGTVSPGSAGAIGTLSVAGTAVFNPGSTLLIDIGAPTEAKLRRVCVPLWSLLALGVAGQTLTAPCCFAAKRRCAMPRRPLRVEVCGTLDALPFLRCFAQRETSAGPHPQTCGAWRPPSAGSRR